MQSPTPKPPRPGNTSGNRAEDHSRQEIPHLFCDMVKIAREMASEADLQMRMQALSSWAPS